MMLPPRWNEEHIRAFFASIETCVPSACLTEILQVDIDGALACYAAAVSLEPKSGWLLDAFGSLLADIGR